MKPETKEQIVRTFVPSEEMAEYLVRADLSEETLADIIAGSPLPLETKAKYAWGEDKLLLDRAIGELDLRSGEVFSLTEEWYDEQIKDVKRAPSDGLFLCFQNAVDAMRRERAEGCADLDACCWYSLHKWSSDEHGNLVNAFVYTFWDDKPVFVRKRRGERENVTIFDDRLARRIPDLNLPVPFAVGDILRVDCRPFFPPLPVLLLEKGDNRDCCCLQALYRNAGAWRTAALKHGLHLRTLSGEEFFGNLISPLYRLAKWTGELLGLYARLIEVRDYLNGDEQKGRAVWETGFPFRPAEREEN